MVHMPTEIDITTVYTVAQLFVDNFDVSVAKNELHMRARGM